MGKEKSWLTRSLNDLTSWIKTYTSGVSILSPQIQYMFNNQYKITNTKYKGYVYDVIDTWGLHFSKAVFRLYEKTDDTKIELQKHPFLSLFDNPNPLQTWWQIKYGLASDFGLFGDSYIYKIRDGLGVPRQYQRLLSPMVTKNYDSSGRLENYTYSSADWQITIEPEDMINLKYPHPESDKYGYAIINSVADIVDVNDLQMQYSKKFYEEGGFLGLTFSTKLEMTPANFKRTLKMLKDEYKGVKNGSKMALFDNDLKPVPAAYSMKDMDINSQRQTARDDILAAWRVPKILLGIGESINRATAEAAIFQFTSGTIDPVLNYVDSELTKDIQKEFGGRREFVVIHDRLAPKDQEAELEFIEKNLKNGLLTLNEGRKMQNLNPYNFPMADKPFFFVGGALVDLENETQIATQTTEVVEVETTESDSKAFDEQTLTLMWKQFNTRLEQGQRRFNRAIEGYSDSQRRRITEAVKDNFIVGEVFNLTEEDAILFQLLEIELWSIMSEGYKYGAFRHDISPTLNREALESQFLSIANNGLLYNQTTLNKLNQIETEGLSVDESLTKVNKVYKEASNRIMSVSGAFNAGLLQAMKDARITKKTWLSSRDSRVRQSKEENHVQMDGKTVGIDEPFEVKSRGGVDIMQYPGDPNGSPENNANDRCTIIGGN